MSTATAEPNYDIACIVCGQKPTVDIVEDDTVKHMELYGVCCFLDADCADPENW